MSGKGSELKREEVLAALEKVMDPELGRSVVALNMVRDIDIQPNRLRVMLALTVEGCPLKHVIQEDARTKLSQVAGDREVQVDLTTMTPEERERLFAAKEDQPKSRVLEKDSPTTVIAVGSGKGGVGKSTLTANLAVALRKMGHSIGVIDADIYGFSLPRILGATGRPQAHGEAIIPLSAYGMQVMSMGFFVDEHTPIIWRGPMLSSAITQFLRDVLWADPDFLVVDLPPGTGDVPLTVAQQLPRANLLVITTPQQASVDVAVRAGYLADKTGMRVVGVVENMSHLDCPECGRRLHPFGQGGGSLLARELGAPLLASIPLDSQLMERAEMGRPLVADQPDSPAAQALQEAAERIATLLKPQRQS